MSEHLHAFRSPVRMSWYPLGYCGAAVQVFRVAAFLISWGRQL